MARYIVIFLICSNYYLYTLKIVAIVFICITEHKSLLNPI